MNEKQHRAVLKVEAAKRDERIAAQNYNAATRRRTRAEAELRREARLDPASWNQIEAVK